MTLPLPQLDDRRFSDLVAELRSLIPRYSPTWTNHNPADPGMTLLELLAWLAEMVLYRLNRVEDRTYRVFLELLGVQPSSPQTIVSFEFRVPQASLADGFVIPQGTRTSARDADLGKPILFETLAAVALSQGRWDAERSVWTFKAPVVNTIEMEQEFLGFATGKPRLELRLPSGPIFLDRENEPYSGNPTIFVHHGGSVTSWRYRRDLLGSSESDTHFTVEQLAGLVRFGDGEQGAIPSEGAGIFCAYRRYGGSKGNVKAKSITELMDPIPGISDPSVVSVFNDYAAEGGVDGETLDDLLTRGLSLMAERARAVCQEDFEALTIEVARGRVARVKAVFDRNLEDAAAPVAEAHVSVVVLPAASWLWPEEASVEGASNAEAVFLRHPLPELSAALGGGRAKDLLLDILAFLDERRLITTVVHVVRPSFTPLWIDLSVQARSGVSATSLVDTIRRTVGRFLDPYAGWLDGEGWPFGRKVYRSELYQQIEGIEGVDHVDTLFLNGDRTVSLVDLGEFSLPCLGDLNVTVLQETTA